MMKIQSKIGKIAKKIKKLAKAADREGSRLECVAMVSKLDLNDSVGQAVYEATQRGDEQATLTTIFARLPETHHWVSVSADGTIRAFAQCPTVMYHDRTFWERREGDIEQPIKVGNMSLLGFTPWFDNWHNSLRCRPMQCPGAAIPPEPMIKTPELVVERRISPDMQALPTTPVNIPNPAGDQFYQRGNFGQIVIWKEGDDIFVTSARDPSVLQKATGSAVVCITTGTDYFLQFTADHIEMLHQGLAKPGMSFKEYKTLVASEMRRMLADAGRKNNFYDLMGVSQRVWIAADGNGEVHVYNFEPLASGDGWRRMNKAGSAAYRLFDIKGFKHCGVQWINSKFSYEMEGAKI